MKRSIIFALLFSIHFFILGCSLSADVGGKKVVDADVGEGGQHVSYKYNLSCNGCKTGDKKFDSKEAYCGALLDEGTNNSCCRRDREDIYRRDCN